MHMGKPPHFIRAWRKHRGLTLEKLAERIHMTHQNLGKVERFKVPYTQHLLEALATELRCEPADLIMRDPTKKSAYWTIYDQLRPEQREKLVEYGEFIKGTGTEG